MCGIVGAAAGWLSEAERERFRELMIVSNLRGYRGAGIIKATNSLRSVKTYKTIGTGIDVAYGQEFGSEMMKDGTPSILIGHTRFPTKGAVTLEATHPHVYDGVYGVHNGTIDSIDGKYIAKDESDSAKLYEAIAAYGVKDVLPTVRGAYALVWVDEKDKTLNFIRNAQRPLYIAVMKSGQAMYWASEASMLHFILGRHGYQYDLVSLDLDTHISFDLPFNTNLHKTPRQVEELKSAPAVAAIAPFRNSQTTSGSCSSGSTTQQQGTSGESKGTQAAQTGGKRAETPSTLYLPNKPKMKWCKETNTWVVKEEGAAKPTGVVYVYCPHQKKYVDPKELAQTTSNDTSNTGVSKDTPTTTAVVPYTDGKKPTNRKEEFRAFLSEMFDEAAKTEEKDDPYGLSPGVYHETIKGQFVSDERIRKVLDKGCSWCGSPAEIECFDALQWIEREEFVCPDCTSDPWTCEYLESAYPGVTIKNKAA